jgi:DNA-binding MarR family transcriptional regulator
VAQPHPDEDAATRAWRSLTAVFLARKESFAQITASFGLNPGAMHALLSLDPDVPQSMSTLAGSWRCDASNVTWLVDRLEEHGLAERCAHPTDRRVRTVALTKKGARVRAQVEAKLFEAPGYMHDLSPRDLETLCRILDKIAPEGGPHF